MQNLFLLLVIFCTSMLQAGVLPETCHSASCGEILHNPAYTDSSARFNALNTLIRDNAISRQEAITCFDSLLIALANEYHQKGGKDFEKKSWIFPLQGYDIHGIANTRNHGFLASGYDYFTGNRHGGHPALDIFIHDRNQDSLDDQTSQPVNVVSLTGGMVVALESEWKQDSSLRGGKYIWIYDPANELLVYYAHQDAVYVKLGEIVEPGKLIGTVGRTGRFAREKRSSTHLHLSVLTVNNGLPLPFDIYGDLLRATTMPQK